MEFPAQVPSLKASSIERSNRTPNHKFPWDAGPGTALVAIAVQPHTSKITLHPLFPTPSWASSHLAWMKPTLLQLNPPDAQQHNFIAAGGKVRA